MRGAFLGPVRWLILLVVLVAVALLLPALRETGPARSVVSRATGRATVEDRLEQYGPGARARHAPHFRRAGMRYPPAAVTLAAFKQEEVLEVYAWDGERSVFIRSYPFTAASGVLGPKLREGDRQVPEGPYRVTYLNPNSQYHLSLRVGYPSEQDVEWARAEGRTGLGGDIMIHGNAVSIGCIAVGDEAAEDLFVLAADVGMKSVQVVISPVDFRRRALPAGHEPIRPWVPELYRRIEAELGRLPLPAAPGTL